MLSEEALIERCCALDRARRYRSRRVSIADEGAYRVHDGRRLLTFASNDYLALAHHPAVVDAFKRGADTYGVGSGAAHLVTGHTPAHHALEEELAAFVARPRALLFSTGYMANLGVIATLAGRNDLIFEDRYNHASLIDGAQLSRARLRRYPHGDTAALTRMLADQAPLLIATDGVFSMDGDLAPLADLATIARRSGAWLMVDDAHGLGVLGRDGRGTLEHIGLGIDDAPVLVGTLGKALGTFGAFVAGSDALVETLIQQARSYIYTTAPPPAVAEATRASLRIVGDEPWRRERLTRSIERFRQGAEALGLSLMDSHTPIQPLIAGTSERALAWSAALEEQGVLVTAIRPPTVPEGSARLRITFSAAHTDADVDRLLEAISRLK